MARVMTLSSRERSLLFIAHPGLWPMWPVLPVVRRTRGRQELGVMFDFRGEELGALTARFYESGRIVSAVCHGPAGILDVTLGSGEPMIKGKRVTGFSWVEEQAAQRADAVPFRLEDELAGRGAHYSKAGQPFEPYVVVDGQLITGQNPGSALPVAQALVRALKERAA